MDNNSNRTENNETRLFELVRNWFKLHPDSLIPHDSWKRKQVAFGIPDATKPNAPDLKITTSASEVSFSNPDLIPFFAAVSLNQSDERISSLISHHNLSELDIRKCYYGNIKCESGDEPKVIDEKSKSLKCRNVTYRFGHGMVITPGRDKDLESMYSSENWFSVVLLSSSHKHLWQNTKINEFHDARTVVHDPEDIPTEIRERSFLYGLRGENADEILKLLERGGVFNLRAREETGAPPEFISDLVSDLESSEVARRVMTALNSPRSPGERAAISHKIMCSMSLSGARVDGAQTLIQLLKFLDQDVYPEIFDSKILKINAFEWPVVGNHITSPHHKVDYDSLFCDLSNELTSVKPADFVSYHFKALCLFAKHWNKAHNPKGIDLSALTFHIMSALDNFFDEQGERTMPGRKADVHVSKFIELISPLGEFNYEMLNQLSSRSKKLLCQNGFKIKMFTGMSNIDKGKVLSDELCI
ncbi:hypothetical protein [Pseudomonas putida]|uniref:Uncharacterized protein n=1 Tax=Pseudomonas putida TaxID=303 RepID=A0A8I1EC54_PSEPU|nr:hypothetical protein [Pseudomonas putida]MBI6882647.1 hypothetical protein [Pseudomonas putida]